jgi:phosphopantetheinyl transferase
VLDLAPGVAFRVVVHPFGPSPDTGTLSSEERARLADFGSRRRRDSFALGRIAARQLLGEWLGIRAQDVPLVVAPDGACDVEVADLRVSIAHTATVHETVAVAAVADRALGVDVEMLGPRREDLYTRILSPDEYPLLGQVRDDHPQVVLWALKEAVLKARRSGFRCAARDVRLQLDPDAGGGLATIAGSGERWELRYEVRGEVVISIAYAA